MAKGMLPYRELSSVGSVQAIYTVCADDSVLLTVCIAKAIAYIEAGSFNATLRDVIQVGEDIGSLPK